MSGPSARVLALLSLLQARRDWPGDELSRRLEVSPRTLRRDVKRLRELGYRVEATRGPAGGYRLTAGSDLPPLVFDEEQAVATALALAVAPASGADVEESAARALATIRQLMPARLRHRVDTIHAVTPASQVVVDPDVLVAVSEAVTAAEVLRFDHVSDQATDRAPDHAADDGGGRAQDRTEGFGRRVEPHAIVARRGRWYLLGWDLDRSDWRTFRIDRIRPRPRTWSRFSPRPIPGGDAAAFVAARFKGSDDGDRWPCVGTVRLTGGDVARLDPYLPEGAVLAPSAAGGHLLTIGSWSWAGLAGAVAGLLAGFEVDFVVEEPAPLVRATADLTERLRAATPVGAGSAGQDRRRSEPKVKRSSDTPSRARA